MADGFKIADAFVEVEVDLDRRQITGASVAAGRESGKAFGAGFGREQKKKGRNGLVGSVTSGLGSLVGVAGRIGTKVGSSLASAAQSGATKLVSGLPSALSNPYVLAAAVAAAQTVGTVAGAALSGAILAGVGTGVVAAGIALAVKDPRVEKELSGLGEFLISGLTSSATSFLEPVRAAIREIKSDFRGMLPDISGIFREASQYVLPLTRAVSGFVSSLLPGIRAALANLGPIFDVLQTALPKLGDTIGDSLDYLAQNAEGAAAGLEIMFNVLDTGILVITATLATLSQITYGVKVAAEWVDNLLSKDDEKTVMVFGKLNNTTQDLAKSTEEVVDETKTFIAVLDRLNATAINAIDTEGAYQQAIDNVARAKKEEHAVLVMSNGVLVQNTERQRAGAAAINEVAKAALDKAKAVHEATLKTGTMAQADAAARESIIKSRAEFIKLAEKLGLTAAQAKKLADELLGIPKTVTTTVTTKYIKVDGGYILAGDEGPRGHAEGGLIRGAGTGTSDSIVRRLSDGEYVIKAAAVKRLGTKTLDAINGTGQVPSSGGGGSTAVMERPGAASGGTSRPIMVNMAGAAFYGVGSADKFVADLYDALDRYEKRYR
jgi:hypothetical protein